MLGIGGGAIMVPLLVWSSRRRACEGAYPASGRGHGDGDHPLHLGSERARARGARRDPLGHREERDAGHPGRGLVGSWIASFIPPVLFAALFTAVIYIAATISCSTAIPGLRAAAGFAGMSAFGFLVSRALRVRAIGARS